MLKKITKWETEDGTIFDTQEEAEDYMFEQDKEVMVHTTEQERAEFEAHFKHLDLTQEPDAWGVPRYKHDAVSLAWEAWQASAAPQPSEATVDHSLTVEVSPVQMPEPAAVVVAIDRKVFADGVLRVSSASISFCDLEKVDLGSNLYTEQQVMDLLKCGGISVKTSK